MEITIQQGGIQTVAADAIIVNLFQGVTAPGGATGVVDGVSVDQPAAGPVLDPRLLGEAEVASLPHHPGPGPGS